MGAANPDMCTWIQPQDNNQKYEAILRAELQRAKKEISCLKLASAAALIAGSFMGGGVATIFAPDACETCAASKQVKPDFQTVGPCTMVDGAVYYDPNIDISHALPEHDHGPAK